LVRRIGQQVPLAGRKHGPEAAVGRGSRLAVEHDALQVRSSERARRLVFLAPEIEPAVGYRLAGRFLDLAAHRLALGQGDVPGLPQVSLEPADVLANDEVRPPGWPRDRHDLRQALERINAVAALVIGLEVAAADLRSHGDVVVAGETPPLVVGLVPGD